MKPFVLVQIGPDGSRYELGAYASLAAASRQLNRRACSVEKVWHFGGKVTRFYEARDVTVRIERRGAS